MIKKTIVRGLMLLTAFLFTTIAVNIYVKNRVNKVLKEKTVAGLLTYSHLDVNVFTGSFTMDSIGFFPEKSSSIRIGHIEGEGFSFWKYWLKNRIQMKRLIMTQLEVVLVNKDEKKNKQNDLPGKMPEIKIGILNLNQAGFILKKDTSTALTLSDYSLVFEKFHVEKKPFNDQYLFDYSNMKLKGGRFFWDLSSLQTLEADAVEGDNTHIVISGINLRPKYSEQGYVRVVAHEMDLVDIHCDSLALYNYKIEHNESVKGFTASTIVLNHPDAKIYRDKTLPDDPAYKKMYGKLLRDMNLKLKIDTLRIRDGDLSYKEKQEKTGSTGSVFFKKIDAMATSITNTDMNRQVFPETNVAVSCLLYGSAPMKINWTFKINDVNENFTFRGNVQQIPIEKLNLLFIPAMNMRVKGKDIEDIHFEYHGNRSVAHGNFKMEYENLKIDILKPGTRRKKGFLSFLGNIFVSHKNKREDQQIDIGEVERDPTKSFWNYIWTCTFTGIKATLLP